MATLSQFELYLEELAAEKAGEKVESSARETGRFANQNRTIATRILDPMRSIPAEMISCLDTILMILCTILWLLVPNGLKASSPSPISHTHQHAFRGIHVGSLCGIILLSCVDVSRYRAGLWSFLPVYYVAFSAQRFCCFCLFCSLMLSSIYIFSITYVSWKLQTATHRLEIAIRFLRRLQLLTLGRGMSPTLPPIFPVLLSHSNTTTGVETNSDSWSQWMSSHRIKQRLHDSIQQLESHVCSQLAGWEDATAAAATDSVDISGLLQRVRGLLASFQTHSTLTLPPSSKQALFVCCLVDRTWHWLCLLATVTHVIAVTEAVLRHDDAPAASAHKEAEEGEEEGGEEDAFPELAPQIALLRCLRRRRVRVESLWSLVYRCECALHRCLGAYSTRTSPAFVDELRDLIRRISEESNVDNADNNMIAEDMNDAFRDFEQQLLSRGTRTRRGRRCALTIDARSSPSSNEGEEDEEEGDDEDALDDRRTKTTVTTGSVHEYSSAGDPQCVDPHMTTNADNASSTMMMMMTEVFVATVVDATAHSSSATNSSSLSSSLLQQQQAEAEAARMRRATQALLGELHHSLVRRHGCAHAPSASSSATTATTATTGSATAVAPSVAVSVTRKQRVRDFDTSTVREEDVHVSSILAPIVPPPSTSTSALESDDDDSGTTRLASLARQLEPDKRLVREELRGVLVGVLAAARGAPSSLLSLSCTLGDDDNDDNEGSNSQLV